MAAPTYHNSASNPADNGSLTEPQTGAAITPPASMQAGDLVVVVWGISSPQGTSRVTLNNNGGQSWTKFLDLNNMLSGTQGLEGWWCEYDGTWDANPSWDVASLSGTQPCTGVMHVFRKPASAGSWALDGSVSNGNDGTDPFTATGRTTGVAQTVTLAIWQAMDDNTWGSLSGTGWSVTGTAQYRNTGGGDSSLSFAHYLADAASTATGDPSKSQLTLGPDTAGWALFTFGCPTSGTTLSPSLATETDGFFTHTLTPGAVSLSPSPATETDGFFTHVVAQVVTLDLATEADGFFAHTLTVGAVNLQPALATETDGFFAHTLTPGAVSLSPDLATEADGFFTHTAAATYSLTPDLATETDGFFTHTLAATYALVAALAVETDGFFTPTVSGGGGTQTLEPALATETDGFFAPTVTPGGVTLAASLATEADAFFSPTILQIMLPDLAAETDAIFLPTVVATKELLPALAIETDGIFPPTALAIYLLLPALVTEVDGFFSPLVGEGINRTLFPTLSVELDGFPVHALALGAAPAPGPQPGAPTAWPFHRAFPFSRRGWPFHRR